jgi:hypothetical protein
VILRDFGPCIDDRGSVLRLPSDEERYDLDSGSIYLDGKKVGFIKDHVVLVNLVTDEITRSFSWKIEDGKLQYTDRLRNATTGYVVNRKAVLKNSEAN